jgi:hypothetical protein
MDPEQLLRKQQILRSHYAEEIEDGNPLAIFLELYYRRLLKQTDKELERRGMQFTKS